MGVNFDKYAREGNFFIKELAKELDMEHDLDRAGRIITSILQALREVIPISESFQFMAQLPMFLKALYVNGWSMNKKGPKIKNREQFMKLVREQQPQSANVDFGYELEDTSRYVEATLIFLRQYVSAGEMKDIRDTLPKDLKNLFSFPFIH